MNELRSGGLRSPSLCSVPFDLHGRDYGVKGVRTSQGEEIQTQRKSGGRPKWNQKRRTLKGTESSGVERRFSSLRSTGIETLVTLLHSFFKVRTSY